jgi:hypothetical protein
MMGERGGGWEIHPGRRTEKKIETEYYNNISHWKLYQLEFMVLGMVC